MKIDVRDEDLTSMDRLQLSVMLDDRLHRRAWRFVKRVLRTAHALAKDPRLPKWLRILFAIGCVQIPVLPFDEVALVLAVAIIAIRHRPVLRDAWATTA